MSLLFALVNKMLGDVVGVIVFGHAINSGSGLGEMGAAPVSASIVLFLSLPRERVLRTRRRIICSFSCRNLRSC